MRKRSSRRRYILPSLLGGMLILLAIPVAHGAPPTPTASETSDVPRAVTFGSWTVVEEEPARARSSTWRIRADQIERRSEGLRFEGAVRAVSETTVVAAPVGRLTHDGLVVEDASIYVDDALFTVETARLRADTDDVRLDRPGRVRPELYGRPTTPQE